MRQHPAVLGIGTATYLPGYGIDAAAVPPDDLVRTAVARGVRYLDTAADYGDGERVVGRVARGSVRVCTKVRATATLADLRASVERLGREPDTILMHSAAVEQLHTAPAVDVLQQARRAGLTHRIGASTYGSEAATTALSQAWCETVQIEFSILNQSVLAPARAVDPNKEIVVRSVLCKGLLTSRRDAVPALAAPVADALAGLEACAREWRRPVEELAIRFALDAAGVDVVLVGVATEHELDVALAAEASTPLTDDQWTRLAALDRRAEDAVHPERWGAMR